jgi:hypothetical protein
MSKKNKHPRVCKICQKVIGEKEEYCNLIEYKEGREFGNGFYHTSCWRQRFMNFEKLQQDANKILSGARGLLTKQGVDL